MSRKMIQISTPAFGEEEWQALKEPLTTGWVTQGPKVEEFQNLFIDKHKVNYAFAVTSCTTALQLALAACKIGPGDEVIIPSFTWVATANVVIHAGATPVLVDIDLATYNIDASRIAAKINDKTKAIIPVHLFGLCSDMDAVKAASRNLKLIEDAACATAAEYKGKFAGALGDLGCFSFHPRKSITTGEGGMVTTNDADLAAAVQMLRNHGAAIPEEQRHQSQKPWELPAFPMPGFNFRMTDLQGALGVVQMNKLDYFINERQAAANTYKDQLADVKWLRTPVVPKGYRHGWQAYVLYVDPEKAPMSREELMAYLHEKGISARTGTHAVHMLDFYIERFGFKEEDYPNSLLAHKHSMAIPLHNRMSTEDYEYIIETLRSI